jgi:cyd operon protein YbgT
MWYFAWMLGLGLACAFAILNAMWLELEEPGDKARRAAPRARGPARRERLRS